MILNALEFKTFDWDYQIVQLDPSPVSSLALMVKISEQKKRQKICSWVEEMKPNPQATENNTLPSCRVHSRGRDTQWGD